MAKFSITLQLTTFNEQASGKNMFHKLLNINYI